jgi:hypothetical protein
VIASIRVIPREGVERKALPALIMRIIVIPREGVESAQGKTDYAITAFSCDPERGS